MKYEKWTDWFTETEKFADRSERFYDTLRVYLPDAKITPEARDFLERWLEAAFECGKKGE